jgi:S-adenosylmethionine uptake transporter
MQQMSQLRSSRIITAGPMLQAAVGIGLLCGMDAVVKYLSIGHAVLLVTVARYLFGVAFAGMIWWGAGRPAITREMLPAHAARGVMIAICAFLFYWSVTVLTLAEAITLSFSAPLLIPPLASVMLGEKMRWRNVVAGLVGFVGVLVAVHGATAGGGEARWWGVAASLGASLAYAFALVLLRARAARDGSVRVTLLGSVFPLLILAPMMVFLSPESRALPALDTLPWFIALGVLGNAGVQLLSRAYARAEAQALAPLEFTGLLWAAMFGWLFFGEGVKPETWIGGAIIAGACLWSARAPAPID